MRFWTESRVEKLKKGWEDGLSAGLIAQDLGCSRCSVLGKAHRLKLSPRRAPMRGAGAPSKIKPEEITLRSKAMPIKRKAPVPFRKYAPPALRLSVLELKRNSCRYPVQDSPIAFCGAEQAEGRSYCAHHYYVCKARSAA